DADDLRAGAHLGEDVPGVADRDGGDAELVVGHEVLARVADVELVLEDLDLLAGDGGEAEPSDQFLGLSREHRSADHFNPAAAARELMHGRPTRSIIAFAWPKKRK